MASPHSSSGHFNPLVDRLLLEPPELSRWRIGYLDFQRRCRFVHAGAFLVTRTKAGGRFNRLASLTVDKSTGVRSDHLVRLTLQRSAEHSPDRLRRVSYQDPDTGKLLVFLTNNFNLPPPIIAQLYKCRWQVELFFKWTKQNLCIKHFFGTTDNAVKTRVWIAVCFYVLVAILCSPIPR